MAHPGHAERTEPIKSNLHWCDDPQLAAADVGKSGGKGEKIGYLALDRGVELQILGCGEVVESGALADFWWENRPHPKHSANLWFKILGILFQMQRSIVYLRCGCHKVVAGIFGM